MQGVMHYILSRCVYDARTYTFAYTLL